MIDQEQAKQKLVNLISEHKDDIPIIFHLKEKELFENNQRFEMQIKLLNQQLMENLILISKTLQIILKQNQLTQEEVLQYTNQELTKYFKQDQLDQFQTYLKHLIDYTYELIKEFIEDLLQKELGCDDFYEYMTHLVERAICRMAHQMQNFTKIESDDFYKELKLFFHSTIQNINQYIIKVSQQANQEMEALNNLLKKYPSLANVRTYQVLQIEVSHKIIGMAHQTLRESSLFRIEYTNLENDIVNQTIRYFYDYINSQQDPYQMSQITTSFKGALKMYDILFSKEEDLYSSQLNYSRLESDQFLQYKDWLDDKRKVRSQQMLTNGTLNGALVGGSIGAGIGCLIVDCTDPKITWNEKLKRAGFSTVSTGLVGAAMRLPVVGIMISQAIILYAVGHTASNKVVSSGQKAKNMAHIGVQSTMGMGSAIAGQILIPIPVLGAVIGGTVGGVAMGLYQKYVVQKNKPSIRNMLDKLKGKMTEDGQVVFDEEVMEIMKISKKHFDGLKPEEFSNTLWLTVVSVYLINEIHYLNQNQTKEYMELLSEKMEKKPNEKKYKDEWKQLEVQEEQIEILYVQWEKSRIYLQDQDIKILNISENIGQFVGGMLQNFKL